MVSLRDTFKGVGKTVFNVFESVMEQCVYVVPVYNGDYDVTTGERPASNLLYPISKASITKYSDKEMARNANITEADRLCSFLKEELVAVGIPEPEMGAYIITKDLAKHEIMNVGGNFVTAKLRIRKILDAGSATEYSHMFY